MAGAPPPPPVKGASFTTAVWEQARAVTRDELHLILPPPPPLEVGMSVSLNGVPSQPKLDGTGAKLLVDKGDGTWSIQHENYKKKPFDAPAAAMTPLPPLPKDGVSLECLRSFREGHPELFHEDGHKTTTDACLKAVMPITKQARTSLSTVLKHLGAVDDEQKPFVGPATVFVSHAWRYRALDVFEAMEAFAAAQAVTDPSITPYFWFDLFVNDQHEATSLPQLWWREAFLDGVRHIGHTCLVLAPWYDPIPLTRAWCLWEILSTMRMGATLTVQMVPTEAKSFTQARAAACAGRR